MPSFASAMPRSRTWALSRSLSSPSLLSSYRLRGSFRETSEVPQVVSPTSVTVSYHSRARLYSSHIPLARPSSLALLPTPPNPHHQTRGYRPPPPPKKPMLIASLASIRHSIGLVARPTRSEAERAQARREADARQRQRERLEAEKLERERHEEAVLTEKFQHALAEWRRLRKRHRTEAAAAAKASSVQKKKKNDLAEDTEDFHADFDVDERGFLHSILGESAQDLLQNFLPPTQNQSLQSQATDSPSAQEGKTAKKPKLTRKSKLSDLLTRPEQHRLEELRKKRQKREKWERMSPAQRLILQKKGLYDQMLVQTKYQVPDTYLLERTVDPLAPDTTTTPVQKTPEDTVVEGTAADVQFDENLTFGAPQRNADREVRWLQEAQAYFAETLPEIHYAANTFYDHPINRYAPEICVVGCSNSGKSTFLNAVMGVQLARSSSAPGMTKLLHAYGVGPYLPKRLLENVDASLQPATEEATQPMPKGKGKKRREAELRLERERESGREQEVDDGIMLPSWSVRPEIQQMLPPSASPSSTFDSQSSDPLSDRLLPNAPRSRSSLAVESREAPFVQGSGVTIRAKHRKAFATPQNRHALVLVDTPGYGFRSRTDWGIHMEKYLTNRASLRAVIFLLRGDVPNLTDADRQAIAMLMAARRRVQIVVTRLDRAGSEWMDRVLALLGQVNQCIRENLGYNTAMDEPADVEVGAEAEILAQAQGPWSGTKNGSDDPVGQAMLSARRDAWSDTTKNSSPEKSKKKDAQGRPVSSTPSSRLSRSSPSASSPKKSPLSPSAMAIVDDTDNVFAKTVFLVSAGMPGLEIPRASKRFRKGTLLQLAANGTTRPLVEGAGMMYVRRRILELAGLVDGSLVDETPTNTARSSDGGNESSGSNEPENRHRGYTGRVVSFEDLGL